MKKTIQWLVLAFLAMLGLIFASPVVFIVQVVYRIFSNQYDLVYYFKSIAVGIDALGGSFLYGSVRHTVSAMSGYFAYRRKSKWHMIQVECIDFFFGEDHCYNEMLNEKL